MNFFAIQVMTGCEDFYIELFSKTRADQPLYSIKKKMTSKKKGKTIILTNPIFPGYIFFQCSGEKPSPELMTCMKRVRTFTRFLPASDNIKPLNERDAEIIRHLLSFGKELGSSLVMFDENNRIKVIKGPLFGMEGKIIKVDRRKRRAKIQLEMNDSPMTFDLAFEVIEAIKDKPA
jgi:transcriptional antiterminator NusG